jgi:hypothetical protein
MPDLQLTLGGHEKFQELCALYPTGSLTEPELASLRQHLERCESCRSLLAYYRSLDRTVVPFVAEREQPADEQARWRSEEQKRRLFASLDGSAADEGGQSPEPARTTDTSHNFLRFLRLPRSASALAAGVVFAALFVGGAGYFAGLYTGTERSAREALKNRRQAGAGPSGQEVLAQEQALDTEIKDRDTKIENLSAKIGQQSNDISRLKNLLDLTTADNQQTRSELSTARAQQSVSASDHEALQAQLTDARTTLVSLQGQLRQILDQRTSELMQTATLQRRIDELNAIVTDRDSLVEEQRAQLNSDHDVRELMGARNLFIADVFDIARDGTTKQPFGRVFYTKNKSLVFYAFDLDKQQDIRTKTNVAFQAWGENDADKQQPVNLGVFYMDNEANRRWVLKFDNPSVLERINAVYVTVEPAGGSAKPKGKQLLYAYLEAQPNHP